MVVLDGNGRGSVAQDGVGVRLVRRLLAPPVQYPALPPSAGGAGDPRGPKLHRVAMRYRVDSRQGWDSGKFGLEQQCAYNLSVDWPINRIWRPDLITTTVKEGRTKPRYAGQIEVNWLVLTGVGCGSCCIHTAPRSIARRHLIMDGGRLDGGGVDWNTRPKVVGLPISCLSFFKSVRNGPHRTVR